MRSWIIAALAGCFLGVAGTYAYLSQSYDAKLNAAREEAEKLKADTEEKQKDLLANQSRLKAVEEVNRQLTNKTQATEESTPVPPTPAAPQPARDRTAEMRAFADKMVQRGVDRWKDNLNLTPDQIARLNQLVQTQLQNGQPGQWNPAAIQAALLQVLTPAQKSEYDHVQARESQARLELRAQTQLSQVQSMFDLTDTQKDQIYQKFAALEQTPAAASTPGNREQGRQAQLQRQMQALQGILTPDQLQRYQKAQTNGGGGGGFNGFRGN